MNENATILTLIGLITYIATILTYILFYIKKINLNKSNNDLYTNIFLKERINFLEEELTNIYDTVSSIAKMKEKDE